MNRLGPYEVHPFAELFPLIEGEEFDEMVQNIKEHGLQDPVLLNHDRTVLIDGRNRYRACQAAGIEPTYIVLPESYTDMMITDLIVSKNVMRRQLTIGQRAFIGLAYKERFAKNAEQRRLDILRHGNGVSEATSRDSHNDGDRDDPILRIPGRSNDKAGNIVGTSGSSVARAHAISQRAPELGEKVKAGEMSLTAAYGELKQRDTEKPKPEPAPKASQVMLTLRTHKGEEVPYPKPEGKASFNQTNGDGISWARWSWNPVTGCLHGCDYCYAREIASRFKDVYPVGFTPLFHDERLAAPANTRIPEKHRDDPSWRRVFVCSMADLYGRWVPDEWISSVHSAMHAAPDWEYLLLTKFPARYVGLNLPPSAWVGTSVDEQKRVRIAEDAFRKIEGVKVKWLSLEPLKEPLEFSDLSMFDWVVIGAQTETFQSGKKVPAFAPPFDWVARLVVQAHEAGCRVHLKPNLFNGRPGMQIPDEYPI
ncbi:DUF5131 family protein [Streptomyces sp. XM4011]|uniref:DUF5131 family protein n=1 Tax=Streptomyces sp. XM4011 TaxID=2929780 RepID=UPI001FFA3270|nr:DUF5131 family protein [Streptomyces sp. XM4011]MCK1814617.1 DUF5131 family protein [Streptomyces sp. XM4011]